MKNCCYIFYALLGCINILGCQSSESSDQFVNIQDEFNIDFYEELSTEDRSLVIEIKTTQQFECNNYSIECYSDLASDFYSFHIQNIIEPQICNDGFASASGKLYIPRNDLRSQLAIEFVIQDDVRNSGTLMRDGSKYYLELQTSHGITSYVNSLQAIPENFVWVSVGGNLEFNSPDLEIQLESLANQFQKPVMQDGYYGHFNIQQGILQFKRLPVENEIFTFFFQYLEKENLFEFKEKVDELRFNIKGIDISIYTSEGLKL